jgi:hypothetical protein
VHELTFDALFGMLSATALRIGASTAALSLAGLRKREHWLCFFATCA